MVNATDKLTYFDYQRMANYAAGVSGVGGGLDVDLQTQVVGGTAMCVGVPMAFKGVKRVAWDAPKWAWKNFGNYKEGAKNSWSGYWSGLQSAHDAQALARSRESYKGAKDIKSIWSVAKNNTMQPYYAQQLNSTEAKLNPKARNSAYQNAWKAKENLLKPYKDAAAKIENIKAKGLKGKELRAALKEVDQLMHKGDEALRQGLRNGTIKPGTTLGKITNGIKNYTGYNRAMQALSKGAQSSSKVVSSACKGAKGFVKGGGAVTAGIELAFEVPEIIQTYKTLGAGKGTKQLAKSATVAVASGVGYAVGAKVGAIAGAKVGAAIGTCIGGPIGTAIGGFVGGVIGVVGGLFGSWCARKVAKKFVGKSELQKAQEAQARELAKNAQNSDEGKAQLAQAVEAQGTAQGGCDDAKVIEAYETMITQREQAALEAQMATEQEAIRQQEIDNLFNYVPTQSDTTNIFTQNSLNYTF